MMIGGALVLALSSSAAAQNANDAVASANANINAANAVGSPSVLRGEPTYNGVGKRDPFRPFVIEPKRLQLTTPLQKYELGQLKVAGVISGPSTPRAMVEDGGGMGYIVTVGTPMGPNGGVVTAILPSRIVVEESIQDYYGKESKHEVVLAVPTDDGGDKESQRH
jgi:type IV pilus assembly protein PilP